MLEVFGSAIVFSVVIGIYLGIRNMLSQPKEPTDSQQPAPHDSPASRRDILG